MLLAAASPRKTAKAGASLPWVPSASPWEPGRVPPLNMVDKSWQVSKGGSVLNDV